MRQAKRWRYFCDHCKKSGASKPHMLKHETGCCANPGRTCGMCKAMELVQKPLAELLAALERDGLLELQRTADDCPACILAALIQDGKAQIAAGNVGYEYYEFDAKAAFKEAWANIDAKPEPPDVGAYW